MSVRSLQVLVLVVLVSSASTAGAQCAFSHAEEANEFESGLVQWSFPCDSNFPNDMTEGGLTSCSPPQTDSEVAGSPPDGWRWDQFRGRGSGTIKLTRTRNRLASPLNPLGDTTDVKIRLRMSGIVDATMIPASGPGGLLVFARVTFDDRAGGDMTVVDIPASFPFMLEAGKVKLDTSLNVYLNGTGQPGLPPCSTVEIVYVIVADENGDDFATAGSLIPPRPDQLCGFAHPANAGKFEASFVPAFRGCGTPDGNSPNAMTEGSLPSCSPPETFNEDVGNPASGWFLDPVHGKGRVAITPKKEPYRLASGAVNPEGQTGDLRVKLDLSGVHDQAGAANGTGTLSALARITMRDRRGTSNDNDDTPMTLLEIALESPFTLTNGRAQLDTSIDAMLNAIPHPGLPHCSSVEFVAITLEDANGTPFAQLGTWLSP